MLSADEKQAVAETTRVLQIIILALAAGAISFLVVVATMAPPDPLQKNFVMLGLGFAALQVVVAIVVPMVIGAQQRKAVVEWRPIAAAGVAPTSDAVNLLGGLRVRRIIAGAMLDGAAFFNIFAYMQGRHPYSLAAAIVLIAGILLLVPLRPLVEQWLERELRTVRELRRLKG